MNWSEFWHGFVTGLGSPYMIVIVLVASATIVAMAVI
jgi:hypothetical protein